MKNYFIYITALVFLTLVTPLALKHVQPNQEVGQKAQVLSAITSPTLSPTMAGPTLITPTIYCVGGAGVPPCAPIDASPTTATTVPMTGAPSTTVSPSMSASPTSGSSVPSPTTDPCSEQQNSIQHDKGKKKKKFKGGNSGGFIEMLMKFFMWLIEYILKGGNIPPPTTGPEPTSGVEPTDEPEPTDQPQPCEPTESPEPSEDPEPTDEQPSTAPTETVSPTGATTSPTTGASAAPTSGSSDIPAQVLNLANWKLTLPTGSAGKPTEILQPALATYKNDPYFVVAGGAVRFRSPVNGVTTSGSSYPRSELREMNGSSLASWSTSSGTHTMTIEEAITAVPKTKKHVVAGQIHDSEDDVIVIRLEDKKLFVDVNGTDGPTLDANYTLGKKFTVKFEVTGGKTNIYYNGGTTPAHTIPTSYSGAYFKAGAYTQSNCTTDTGDCSANNYGEVIIYNLQVTHN